MHSNYEPTRALGHTYSDLKTVNLKIKEIKLSNTVKNTVHKSKKHSIKNCHPLEKKLEVSIVLRVKEV